MLSSRLLYEIGLLSELKEKNPCFHKFKIKNSSPLLINFSLKIKEHLYVFDLIFPLLYPFQPLIIKSRTEFKTTHQYVDGTMCLKWGIDNWSERIDCKIMIENLIELLELENPLGKIHSTSPSGHQFTSFQERFRYPVTIFIQAADLNFHFPKSKGNGIMIGRFFKNSIVLFKGWFKFMSKKDAIKRKKKLFDSSVLKQFSYAYDKYNISYEDFCKNHKFVHNPKFDVQFWVFKNSLAASYRRKATSDEIKKYIQKVKKDKTSPYKNYSIKKTKKKLEFIYFDAKCIFERDEKNVRTYIKETNTNKNIAIFGLGSVGSRVFIDLVKAGFHKFILCDGDLFLPSNLSRHVLGISDIGKTKIEALLNYVRKEINPDINVNPFHFALNGQSSNQEVELLLGYLKDCALIIDCSADSNLIISLNELIIKFDKPFISGAILSGGLGHVLMKRNSGSPLSILDLLETQKKYMKVNNINQNHNNNYEIMINDTPFVASQSDISIIAGLIGKHAIDMLMNTNPLKDDIYFFSTSNHFLGEPFTVQPITANPIKKVEYPLDLNTIKEGEEIWKSLFQKK